MDDRPRQNPAYRLAKEEAPATGPLLVPPRSGRELDDLLPGAAVEERDVIQRRGALRAHLVHLPRRAPLRDLVGLVLLRDRGERRVGGGLEPGVVERPQRVRLAERDVELVRGAGP